MLSAWGRFVAFYHWLHDAPTSSPPPKAVTLDLLACWAAHMADSGKQVQSCLTDKAALRSFCEENAVPFLTSPGDETRWSQFAKGLRVLFPPRAARRPTPLRLSHLVRIRDVLGLELPRGFQFWVQLLLSHALCLRCSELCALDRDDVRLAGHLVEVVIRGGKTNRGSAPFSVWLAPQASVALSGLPPSARAGDFDVVAMIRHYFAAMGWTLRSPNDGNIVAGCPLFPKLELSLPMRPVHGSHMLRLTYQAWSRQLKFWLAKIGEDPERFTTHCLRAGGTTDLASFGARTEQIMRTGRWRSSVWGTYNRPEAQALAEQTRAVSDAALQTALLRKP